jgi:hypothetical protein
LDIERRDRQESDLPIGLSRPARRALVEAGYLRLEQLTDLSEIEHLHGVGPKALDQLRSALGTKTPARREVSEEPARD